MTTKTGALGYGVAAITTMAVVAAMLVAAVEEATSVDP
jgi:hypothetical protein